MHFRNVHTTFCIRFECDNDYLSFDLFERAERSTKRTNKRKSNRLGFKQRNDTGKKFSLCRAIRNGFESFTQGVSQRPKWVAERNRVKKGLQQHLFMSNVLHARSANRSCFCAIFSSPFFVVFFIGIFDFMVKIYL